MERSFDLRAALHPPLAEGGNVTLTFLLESPQSLPSFGFRSIFVFSHFQKMFRGFSEWDLCASAFCGTHSAFGSRVLSPAGVESHSQHVGKRRKLRLGRCRRLGTVTPYGPWRSHDSIPLMGPY